MEIKAKTITELMEKTTRYMLGNSSSKPFRKTNSLHILDVSLYAQSCVYDLDVRSLWLYKQRWTRLIRQYIDRTELTRFTEQARSILEGEVHEGASTSMLFKDPVKKPKEHKWGGCLIGLTFHGDINNHPTITMYSRTCFMGYIAFLDAAIPYLILLKEILAGTDNISVKDIRFRWHITSMQLHAFKILPYIHQHKDLMKELRYWHRHRKGSAKSVLWKSICRWHSKIKNEYDVYGVDMLKRCKYGPLRRIEKRWLEHCGHLPKKKPDHVYLTELDFEALK